MTASVKILTTHTLDSTPSILLCSPNGHRTLINCGSGCQRSFLESTERVRSVNQICLTHIGYEATGGLPGMILTSADAAQASHTETNSKEEFVGGLRLIGPKGLRGFINSARYFMRRDKFPLEICEENYYKEAKFGHGLNSRNSKKRKKAGDDEYDAKSDAGLFGIESLPMKLLKQTFFGKEEVQVCSYLFTTTPIAGKFMVQKAKQLGIPPGPLYSQLKNGKSVSFENNGKHVTVDPSQVLEGGSDGVAVALIYCPSIEILLQLRDTEHKALKSLNAYKQHNTSQNKVKLEVMIHLTPKSIFDSQDYQNWIQEFGTNTHHLAVYIMEDNEFSSINEDLDGSPFKSAILGAMQRSLIQPNIYPNPIPDAVDSTNKEKDKPANSNLKIHLGRQGMEYVIVPLAKQGIDAESIRGNDLCHGIHQTDRNQIQSEVEQFGALKQATTILETDEAKHALKKGEDEASFIFTGTGSAIPCKHRNVTGMYFCNESQDGMLLDVGEGTLGQLIRSWSSTYKGNDLAEHIRKRIVGIKAVHISHPHADHHLGIVRLLTQRAAILLRNGVTAITSNDNRLILLASNNVLRFLDEYSKVDPTIYGGYISVDNRDTLPEMQPNDGVNNMLTKVLGITQCVSVPVSHCYQSYGVVLEGTSFGKLVYSGDCRPSDALVRVGHGADLLVHEATFENGMEEEAVLKMHSTVSEAIDVAKRMDAKNCILTHFSQRYPRIAPLREEDYLLPFPVSFAFDFMRVTPSTIVLSSKMTTALRLLYPEDEKGEEQMELNEASNDEAKEVLSTPGYFANVQCS